MAKELSHQGSKQAEPSRAKPSRAEPSRAELSRAEPPAQAARKYACKGHVLVQRCRDSRDLEGKVRPKKALKLDWTQNHPDTTDMSLCVLAGDHDLGGSKEIKSILRMGVQIPTLRHAHCDSQHNEQPSQASPDLEMAIWRARSLQACRISQGLWVVLKIRDRFLQVVCFSIWFSFPRPCQKRLSAGLSSSLST